MARGEVLSFLSGKRGGVDGEDHGYGRFLDGDDGKRARIEGVRERIADEDVLHSRHGRDITGGGGLPLNSVEPFIGVDTRQRGFP